VVLTGPNEEDPPSVPSFPVEVVGITPPLPPAPIVTVNGAGKDAGIGTVAPWFWDVGMLKDPGLTNSPPAPPPPPALDPPPPPPATTRYSSVSPKVPGSVTSKVPDEVKMCALYTAGPSV
jgi:hypothetical protein